MPNAEHKKVLSIENFSTMTLEERLEFVNDIMSGLKFRLTTYNFKDP